MKKKRAKPFPANKRSTEKLEAEGWTVCTVEKTVPYHFIKIDAFNFGDLLAYGPAGIMLVQATAGGNMSHRVAKLKENEHTRGWLRAGGKILIHDWVKRAAQKQRVCLVQDVTLKMLGKR